MNEKTLRVAKSVLVAAVLATILWVSAGDLNPPTGAITPTQRTPIGANTTPGDADATPSLYRISAPGSYYLTGNITGVSGKIGIEIAASSVTLDLMGFDLEGVAGSLDGVLASVALTTDIAVINGSVRNWAGDGVDLATAINTRLADLRASANSIDGIVAGRNTAVTECTAYQNVGVGIRVNYGSAITNCSALANGNGGMRPGVCSAITSCSAADNTGAGIYLSAGSTITNCSATANTGDGIRVTNYCTVRGNTCFNNGIGATVGSGIQADGDDNRIEGNNCTLNDRGIHTNGGGNFITRNICSGNTINNWEVGAGNVCLVVNATTSAAIVGNSGGVAPGSTDPNANFTY